MFVHSDLNPAVSNNQWGSVHHNQEDFVFTTGAAVGAGSGATTDDNTFAFSPNAGAFGTLKMRTYQDADWDDLETITLPDTAIGFGNIAAGTDGSMEGAFFNFFDDDPTLVSNTANTQTTDADNKLVIFTDGGVTTIKNQLGNNQVLTMTVWYYIP